MFVNFSDHSHILTLLEGMPDDTVISWNEEEWGLNVASLDNGEWWLNGAGNSCSHEDVARAIVERATDTPRILLHGGTPA